MGTAAGRGVIGFVFARGGSKGLPGKNLRPLAGRTLLVRAIECARASRFIERVVVSTDSPVIAKVARAHGADVPFLRPAVLATDTAPEFLAWKHAVAEIEARGAAFEVFVAVPATAPLRLPSDLDAIIDRLREGAFDLVMAVTEAHRNPWFNMVSLGDDGQARLLLGAEVPVTRRQDAPLVYDMTTVGFAARPAFIRRGHHLWDGRVGAVTVPRARALDIDTEDDLAYAEWILHRRG